MNLSSCKNLQVSNNERLQPSDVHTRIPPRSSKRKLRIVSFMKSIAKDMNV